MKYLIIDTLGASNRTHWTINSSDRAARIKIASTIKKGNIWQLMLSGKKKIAKIENGRIIRKGDRGYGSTN